LLQRTVNQAPIRTHLEQPITPLHLNTHVIRILLVLQADFAFIYVSLACCFAFIFLLFPLFIIILFFIPPLLFLAIMGYDQIAWKWFALSLTRPHFSFILVIFPSFC
jgi:hypothetical protein